LARRPKISTVQIGNAEIIRVGASRGYLNDLYHFLLTRRWGTLLALLFALYLGSNVIFAALYELGGDCIENARPGSFQDLFFFSIQTMATIGYGKMAPITLYAHMLVVLESFSGILWVAMTTGLVFSKFSRPTARVLFSQVAVIGPREGVPTLMIRMANERGNQIVEAHLRVVLIRNEITSDGEKVRRFHDLKLARDSNVIFALSWTGMHAITPDSPLYGATPESLAEVDAQLVVSLIGLDSTSSQTMHARKSYGHRDLRWDARFVDILSRREDGRLSVDYRLFHDVQPALGKDPS
jgi:inward rectifier potassium channel